MATDAELEQAGLHFPGGPYADERLELLHYLLGLGATVDDLVAYREELPGLAMVLAVRLTRPLTLDELVERSGVDADTTLRIIRAAGFPPPASGERSLSPDLVAFLRMLPAAVDLFGEDAIFQTVRVMGSTAARLADSLVSSFLANVQPAFRDEDPVGLRVARANTLATDLLPQVVSGFDAMLRQHLVALRRTASPGTGGGVETREMGVGFVDLVDSTGLALAVTMVELGVLLTEFENLTADVVVAAGGRVVKLIGDEVLYTAPDPASVCAIALEVAEVDVRPPAPAERTGRGGLRRGDAPGRRRVRTRGQSGRPGRQGGWPGRRGGRVGRGRCLGLPVRAARCPRRAGASARWDSPDWSDRCPCSVAPVPGRVLLPLPDHSAHDDQGFTVLDGNYLSARWPGEAYTFARRFAGLLA